MTKELNEKKSWLKPYHTILLACLLSFFMIINSNYAKNKRDLNILNEEKAKLFDKIIYGRMLTSNPDTEEVCSRASDDLKDYYKTGDKSKIDLDDNPIDCEDKNEEYMKNLIDIVKGFIGDDDSSSSSGTLRNLDGGLDTDKIINYGMRLLPMVIFLAISILSIFGWIACCICTCCDCCCCCCCKKKRCKIPCFIFTYVFYALVVAVCVYGLTQSNKIFTGLANTECSFLKFFEQIVDGEIKTDLPRWVGIDGINGILTNLEGIIDTLSHGTASELHTLISQIDAEDGPKKKFLNNMHGAGNKVYEDNDNTKNYKNDFFKQYSDYSIKISNTPITLNGYYILDLIYNFGNYNSDTKKYTDNSILWMWDQEYSFISSQADGYMQNASESFDDILQNNVGRITSALEDAKNTLDDIKKPFDDINKDIGGALSDYSEIIDKYGKLGVKLVFGILMIMNIALGVFIALIGLFSMKSCLDCCCCRCLFKSAAHIFWNILALMMILTFLVGSILGIVGTIGSDTMSLISYIMSSDNFNDPNPLLLNEIKDGKNYLKRCIHGDGDIAAELDITDSIGSIDLLNTIESNITSVLNDFTGLIELCPTYNNVTAKLNNRNELKSDFALINKESNDNSYSFNIIIDNLNKEIEKIDVTEKWKLNSESLLVCVNGNDDETSIGLNAEFNPKNCDPSDRDWIKNRVSSDDIYKLANVAHDFINVATTSKTGFLDILNDLKDDYDEYLGKYVEILSYLKEKIGDIIDVIRPYIEDDNAFSFLNGKFIGTNLKIILKYLKYSLGEDIYTVGLCLIIVGCSLILSISSTLILIVIINLDMKANMDMQNQVQTNVNNPEVQFVVSEFQGNTPVDLQK